MNTGGGVALSEGKWLLEMEKPGYTPEQEDILSGCFDLIYPTLLRMTGDRETALDLTQDTFLRAWEKMNGFEGRSKFSTWLYRVAVNLAITHLKRQRRVTYTESDPAVILDELPEERAEDRFEIAAIRDSVLSLSPPMRACVVLHYYESKPLDEIAEILGIARGTAAWRLHIARKKLKTELRKRGVHPE